KIIDNWKSFIDNLPIMIPYDLEKRYTILGQEAKKIYNDFLEIKIGENKIEDLKGILTKRTKLVNNINKYVEENINNKFIATKSIIQWLKKNNLDLAIQMLREDNAHIKWRTAPRIKEIGFMKLIMDELNVHLKKIGARIKGISEGDEGFLINIYPLSNLDI